MLFVSGDHNHSNNSAKAEANLLESAAIENAKANPSIPPRTIIKDLATSMNIAGPYVTAQMANKETISRRIRAARSKQNARPALPKSVEDYFNLPDQFTLATDGTKFLACVDFVVQDKSKAFLLFISDHGKEVLKTYEVIQCDGTFSTTPDGFEQVYFICGCSPSGKLIPAGFSLLPNKSTATYEAMFTALNESVGNNLSHVKAFVVDFELAVHNVIRDKYPQASISGCIFHQRQALHRQIGFKGVGSLYNQCHSFQEAVALIYSLAFVPPEDVETIFYDVIMEFWEKHMDEWDKDYDAREGATLFARYYELNYIAKKERFKPKQDPIFPICTWNKFSSLAGDNGANDHYVPITNNSLEGFNSR